jgi:branched-chain amino acid transport system ATP-binding protein
VEQDIRNALRISDNAYVLASGKITYAGKAKELLVHEDFERLCVGVC